MFNTTTTILASGLRFPEGPAFASDGSLWAVELKGKSLVNFNDKVVTKHWVGGAPNGIAIDKNDILWFCDSEHNSIRTFNPHTLADQTMVQHIDGEFLNKPNDLAFDKSGNLVFSCPGDSRTAPTGYVGVLLKNGEAKKITDHKYFPNGMAFSLDGKKLILAETYKHRLWIGDWDEEKGEWTNQKVWCDIGGPDGPGGPDGMAFAPNGDLYVAIYGLGMVKAVDENGEIFDGITLPGKNPTNCAFDPNNKNTLVITEAEHGIIYEVKLNNNNH